jgi:hypothetical protein
MDKNVTFYFSSGKEMEVSFSEEKFAEFLEKKSEWDNKLIASAECGINFSLVTHYKVD